MCTLGQQLSSMPMNIKPARHVRAWKCLHRLRNGRLAPLYVFHGHHQEGYTVGKWYRAVGLEHNSGGFYAFKTRAQARAQVFSFVRPVLLRGTIYEHLDGYRASQMKLLPQNRRKK